MKAIFACLFVLLVGACGAAPEATPANGGDVVETQHGHDHAKDAHGHAHGDKAHAHGDHHGHAHGDKAHADAHGSADGDKACDHGEGGDACADMKAAGGECTCAAMKDGTGWCGHCQSGFLNGEKSKDKAAIDAAIKNN